MLGRAADTERDGPGPVAEPDPRGFFSGVITSVATAIVFTSPLRRTVRVTGVSAPAAIDLFAGAFVRGDVFAELFEPRVGTEIGIAPTVDGEDLISPLQRGGGRGLPGWMPPTFCVLSSKP